MTRFLLFVALLVAAAYMLTTPPAPEMALSANEALSPNDKPLLTSWGRSLGSLRADSGANSPSSPDTDLGSGTQTASASKFDQYGKGTELWVLGQTIGWKQPANRAAQDRGWVSDSYVETAAILPAARQIADTDRNTKAVARPENKLAKTRLKQNGTAKPGKLVVDRIAAAKPPQRRGLFARSKTATHAKTAKRAGKNRPNRGFFSLFKGRSKLARRAWAVGPAR